MISSHIGCRYPSRRKENDMDELKQMIKESFDLWVKRRWLSIIEKESRKGKKLLDKYYRQVYVVNRLLEEYVQRFPKTPEKGE
jgi:hypothetical protein